jgi:putative methylase
MQKRLVRKHHLEKKLAEVMPHPEPRVHLEQYTISPEVAAEILYLATYTYNDIINKTVVDLGCGTGRLAIGAVLLGAKEAFGIDIDSLAIKAAKANALKLTVVRKTNWITADINAIHGHFHTVLLNPPFGVQKRRADRVFLEKSLEVGYRIYSLHKSGRSNREFIKKFIEKRDGRVTDIFEMKMAIPKLFGFHTKERKNIKIDLYRIEGETYA